MKLSQQKEKELEMEDMKRDQTSFPLVTRDIICMDLRNHGRTGSHYGSLKMDFEIMARDVIHTLNSLGLSEVHLVGHSLGIYRIIYVCM
jgi:pimeloyl-ACP methyl ester carboxylesterase